MTRGKHPLSLPQEFVSINAGCAVDPTYQLWIANHCFAEKFILAVGGARWDGLQAPPDDLAHTGAKCVAVGY
ncbi:hypothetical protein [Roseovarius sp.]